MTKNTNHYPDPIYQRGQKVKYENRVYTVSSCTHSHAQLVGLVKAVPVWKCQPVEE